MVDEGVFLRGLKGSAANALTPSKHQKKGTGSYWHNLPPELLELILLNLVLKDSTNFKATCSSWRSITPLFPPPIGSLISPCPYLMTLFDDGDCSFFQPLHNQIYPTNFPELKDATILFSICGWLLMCRGIRTRFFFNPFTKSTIQLPDLPPDNDFRKEHFSAAPTSVDCVVIGFKMTVSGGVEFGMIRPGQDRWTFHYIRNSKIMNFGLPRDIVSVNGKLYCLSEDGNIGVLDLSEMKFSISRGGGRPHSHSQSFLVKCDQEILAVFVANQRVHVSSRLVNHEEGLMLWETVCDLEDKVLYVSNYGESILEKAVDQTMANKIFFPKFHGENGVFYSLETRDYQSVTGNYRTRSCFSISDQQFCTWIKATYDSPALGSAQL